MATMDRFRFGMRDALANGLPLTDALGQGISAAAAADEAGRKKGFVGGVRDAVMRGLSPTRAIHDALANDYGVPGMKKGVQKARPTLASRAAAAGPGPHAESHKYFTSIGMHHVGGGEYRSKGGSGVKVNSEGKVLESWERDRGER